MKNTFKEFFQKTPGVTDPDWVPIAKWVRVGFGNEYIASSRQVMLKRGFPFVYFFPHNDVNMELLEKNTQGRESDKWGEQISWHVSTKSKKAENAA